MKAILIGAAASLSVVFAHDMLSAVNFANENNGVVIDASNAEHFAASELVAAWNVVAEQEPELFKTVNRFATKAAAFKRFDSMCVNLSGLQEGGEKINVTVVGKNAKKPKQQSGVRPSPVVAGKPVPKERWRREKYTAPGKTSYAPRKNSLQEKMMKLLTRTRSGNLVGVTAEKFCEDTNAFSPNANVKWTPSNMWSQLNYLFVSQKGYGLKFNGTHIMLIEAEDHRAAT